MSRYVQLATLSRRELENLLLTEHGALSRILEAVRTHTEPQWKVRREVERIVHEATDQRPFVIAYTRGLEAEIERRRSDHNAVQWARWVERPA